MAHWHEGFDDIKVKLICFEGDDLARKAYEFNKFAEFNEANGGDYSPTNPEAIRIINEIISGETFSRFAFEGQRVAFQIENISRVCLAQLTRERGFFCSASSGVRPLSMDFIVPRNIYQHKEWMRKIQAAQNILEDVYTDMLEEGIPYIDARYFGLHAQTINISYTASFSEWAKSCNIRTENNIADEINYVYRLMRNELTKQICNLKDPLSKKLYEWLMAFTDKKSWYKNHTFNNDFKRHAEPEGYKFSEPAHNDWTKSGWRFELEHILATKPELLLPGEKEMIESWQKLEKADEPLPTTYDKYFELCPEQRIKTMDYYKPIAERKHIDE